jgi:hypothetical protein
VDEKGGEYEEEENDKFNEMVAKGNWPIKPI